jgi:ribosomal protein L11 methylase PrmA
VDDRSGRKYHDVVVTVGAADEELAVAELWAHGPVGVRIDVGAAGTTVLTASFASLDTARACAAALDRPAEVRPSPLVDWQQLNADLPDVHVGGHRLRIDPGPTFGWGGHPSTRLLLDVLAADPPAGLRVLDAGCGSGVLAVAAAVLAAAAVTAVDVDPVAVEVTDENARRNGVADRVTASTTPLRRLSSGYDLVLANMLLTDLVDAAADLDRLADRRLAVSGFLVDQIDAVIGAFPHRQPTPPAVLDGWVALVLT